MIFLAEYVTKTDHPIYPTVQIIIRKNVLIFFLRSPGLES